MIKIIATILAKGLAKDSTRDLAGGHRNSPLSRFQLGLLLTVVLGPLTSPATLAAGFSLTEYSVKGMGSSYAGAISGIDEPATVYWNPAGLTRLSGNHAAAGAVLVDLSIDFKDQGSSRTVPTPAGLASIPSSGGNGDDGGGLFVTPNLYLTHAFNDQWVVGLGIHAPFGLETDYGRDWVGRYQAIKSSISTLDINPSLAYRINQHWSIGAGISAQYVDATLSNAIFTGGPDGRVKLSADDWSIGYNVGLMLEASADTRLGLSWRSAIDHQLSGSRRLSGLGALDGSVGADAPLKLPASVAFGLRHRLGNGLTLMGDVVWTGWSSFSELRVSFDDGSPDDITTSNWNNNFRVSLGAEYQLKPQWQLRGGVMFDQSPVPGPQELSPRVPDADRYWISAGASWQVTPAIAVDFAYSHLFFADADINRRIDLAPQAAPGVFTDTVKGRFDNAVDGIAIALRYHF